MSITAIVLAAGASTRMGEPKALVDIEGASFLTHIVRAARGGGVAAVVAVAGPPDGEKIRTRLPAGAGIAWNPDPSRGMLSSIQIGLATLPAGTSSVLIWPVDHPLVRVDTVRHILAGQPGKIVIPCHQGRRGHPVRVPRSLFGAIMALPADANLRDFIESQAAQVLCVDVEDAACLDDIDTPAVLAQVKAERLDQPATGAGQAEPASPPPRAFSGEGRSRTGVEKKAKS